MLLSLFGAVLVVAPSCGGSHGPPTGSPGSPGTAAAGTMVSIPMGATGKGPAAFGANPLVVSQGATVSWTNNDSVAHTSTSDSGVWDSGTLAPGQSFSFQFTSSGSFPYHCTIHGQQSMSGVIQVGSGGAAGSPTPSPSSPAGMSH
ncbi:MAG: cupredoxin domain-containing protein [Bdellovibrionota bacterium]